MKKIFAPAFIIFAFIGVSHSQTRVYIPGGNPAILSSTNNYVGIGISNPVETLHINGTVRGGSTNGSLRIKSASGYVDIGPLSTTYCDFKTDRSCFLFDKHVFSSTGKFASYNTANLYLMTHTTTRMTILNSSGYVGIGTTAPTENLQVTGNIRLSGTLKGGSATTDFPILSDRGLNLTSATSVKIMSSTTLLAELSNSTDGIHFYKDLKLNNGAFSINPGDTLSTFKVESNPSYRHVYIDYKQNLYFRPAANTTSAPLIIEAGGNVGVGFNSSISPNVATVVPSGYKFAVNGGIICEEVKVVQDVPNSDYVFEKEYPLLSLSEVEDFIEENKHLPGIPSADEFRQDGYKLGEMDDMLLRKVEELTLYVIQLNKENNELKEKVRALEVKVK